MATSDSIVIKKIRFKYIMEIQYLKKLKKNSKIGSQKIIGVTENEIQKVEKKFNIIFPKAYREFLLLAGKYIGNLPLYDTANLEDLAADWHQEIMWEVLESTNAKKDIKHPFWMFAESNGCEQFAFFYLEDGEDPIVHTVDYGWEEYTVEIKSSKKTFSQYIDGRIDSAYHILKHGW